MFKRIVIISLLLLAVQSVSAQIESSLSGYSPYTMYGIGDLSVGGTASSRAMGGIGIAVRKEFEFNYQNPASLSVTPQRTAIFNFGMVNSNYYQEGIVNNAYNSVDLHDLGFAIPIAKGLGVGVSLTPLSSVGYNTTVINNNSDIIENIGRAVYSYYGDGGVSELNLMVGWKVFGGFSIGATMHYDFGAIDRHWTSTIYPLISSESYRTVESQENLNISKLRFTLGGQYQIRVGNDDHLTFGATYSFKSNSSLEQTLISYTTDGVLYDTVAFSQGEFNATIPAKIAGGIYFNNSKLGIGFDYIHQNWEGAFATTGDITLGAINDYRFGAQYTPNRLSLRSFFSRLTYKVGGRYATSYLVRNDNQLRDWAVTLGVDMPLRSRNFSALNLGFEYGSRSANAQVLTENYFKVFIGFSFFGGDDMWFVKRKFD